MATEIPDIVIGRLPIYLRELRRLQAEHDKLTTSSHELGERLGISSAQIRKDLSHFGEFGKQGTGYHIGYLVDQLCQILHLDQVWPVVLVGAGSLGTALAYYDGFRPRGFEIRWIFDTDPSKIGHEINGMCIQAISELEETIARHKIAVAIIATPASAAQEVTDFLIESGIKAILSYAPLHLSAPAGVHISYSDPVTELQRMTYYLG
ncbi:MAG: redox-sensing transcriptional repressor Rex [Chloroflexota bacterium]|nr:redox-sensing transcriptional repressor Rex [Anaerolineales bacterium]MCB8968523.1 redox-sensing transcriptional repressor Rex [Ardenticatenaceae bacterium]